MNPRFSVPFVSALALVVALTSLPAGSACAQVRGPYKLTNLQVVSNVLSKIRRRYVNPKRLAPREMMRKALTQIAQQVPEVIVRFKGKHIAEVQVDTAVKRFDLGKVDSPWALSTALRLVFRFLDRHLHPTTKRRNVEYAAVDGILKTLDCHSVLMRPRLYREMRIHTRGSFGGLGITISRCGHPQVLTIVKPLKGTPAYRAGLKKGDQIVRIEKEPTISLTLSEAVKRLRGKPRSKVTIWVRRPGAFRLKAFTIERAQIMLPAVQYRMLKGTRTGYVRIKNFQSTTDWELQVALRVLKSKGMQSLVLDLRNNGGGLLSKAVAVADAFLYSGTIVTTVGYGERRIEKRARWNATVAGKIPMAVLINGGTASASEIVAGALKNLDRAVIIGQRSYGKGSVQMIYGNSDRSALKVTIAQYLTPGDMSVQGMGVIPDIELMPTEIKKNEISYFGVGKSLVREGDRLCSLRRASLALRRPARFRVHHLAEARPRAYRCEPCGVSPGWKPPPDYDEFYRDYTIRLAEKVLGSARSTSRRRMLQAAGATLKQQRRQQEQRIVTALKKVAGVDWTRGPAAAPRPTLRATLTAGQNGVAMAGKAVKIKLTVRNAGTGPAWRVRGMLLSTNPLLQNRELFIGKLGPGESKSTELAVKLPTGAPARIDDVSLRLSTSRGEVRASLCTSLTIKEKPKPVFTYTRQLFDQNADGLLQPGEEVRVVLRVKNVGKGAAGETYARLKGLSGDATDVRKGLFALTGLAPGKEKRIEFVFRLHSRLPLKTVRLRLMVSDCELGTGVRETMKLPISRRSVTVGKVRGRQVVGVKQGRVALLQSPRKGAHVLGYALAGVRLAVREKGAAFYKVALGRKGFAFVHGGAVTMSRGRARGRVQWRWLPAPPKIELAPMARVVRGASVTVAADATDVDQIRDVSIRVSRLVRSRDGSRLVGMDHKKIFYQANRAGTKTKMSFKTQVPLWPGSNVVTITVRKNDEIRTRKTIRILRTACPDALRRAGPRGRVSGKVSTLAPRCTSCAATSL